MSKNNTFIGHGAGLRKGTSRVYIPYQLMIEISRVIDIVNKNYDNLVTKLMDGAGAEDFADEYCYLCKKIDYKGEPNHVRLLQYFVENEALHDYWLL